MKDSNIWGGSEVKVNGYVAPYFTSMVGAGVALRLRAVQVIQYVEGSQGAERFGFGEEDGGFVQETPETFEEVVTTTEASKVEEPAVRKDPIENVDKSDDISGIIDKWSTKD